MLYWFGTLGLLYWIGIRSRLVVEVAQVLFVTDDVRRSLSNLCEFSLAMRDAPAAPRAYMIYILAKLTWSLCQFFLQATREDHINERILQTRAPGIWACQALIVASSPL